MQKSPTKQSVQPQPQLKIAVICDGQFEFKALQSRFYGSNGDNKNKVLLVFMRDIFDMRGKEFDGFVITDIYRIGVDHKAMKMRFELKGVPRYLITDTIQGTLLTREEVIS